MDFLGVGPLELLFIFLIALIVLGPTDMVKAGRTMGRYLRKLVTSPTWRAIQQTSREIRDIPTKLMRDAGLEEDMKDIKKDMGKLGNIQAGLGLDKVQEDLDKAGKEIKEAQGDLSAWTTPPGAIATSPPERSTELPAANEQVAGEQDESLPNTETDKA